MAVWIHNGEKLFEEVLGSGENTQKTHNPKLMIATHTDVDCEETGRAVNGLLNAVAIESAEMLVARMCNLVKEFEPANEKYKLNGDEDAEKWFDMKPLILEPRSL